jgi:hypothetical protein
LEDVVGIKVSDKKNGSFGFMTWGRLWSPVDGEELIAAIRPFVTLYHGVKEPVAFALCGTLQEIRSAPYFYEAIIDFGRQRIPEGDRYKKWQKKMRKEVADGRHLYFVGGLAE